MRSWISRLFTMTAIIAAVAVWIFVVKLRALSLESLREQQQEVDRNIKIIVEANAEVDRARKELDKARDELLRINREMQLINHQMKARDELRRAVQ